MALREVDSSPTAEEEEAPASAPTPKATPIAEAKESQKATPIAAAVDETPEQPSGGRGWKVFSAILALLLLAAVGVIGYQAQTNTALVGEIGALEESLVESQNEVQGFEQQIGQVHEGLLSLAAQVTALTDITAPPGEVSAAAANATEATAEGVDTATDAAEAIDAVEETGASVDAIPSYSVANREAMAFEEEVAELVEDGGAAAAEVSDAIGEQVATEQLMRQLEAIAAEELPGSSARGDVASPGDSFGVRESWSQE